MEFVELPQTDAAIRRFVTDLKVPYQRDLAAATDNEARIRGA